MSQDMGSVSDGYHTFNELYEHRRALTAALMSMAPGWSYRSKAHHPDDDVPMYPGHFKVGMMTPDGQISYHYEIEHWSDFDCVRELPHAPKWDGHTSQDVPRRLLSIAGVSHE